MVLHCWVRRVEAEVGQRSDSVWSVPVTTVAFFLTLRCSSHAVFQVSCCHLWGLRVDRFIWWIHIVHTWGRVSTWAERYASTCLLCQGSTFAKVGESGRAKSSTMHCSATKSAGKTVDTAKTHVEGLQKLPARHFSLRVQRSMPSSFTPKVLVFQVVDDNCVQCPFHGWVFSAETGKCTRIPYDNGTIPEQAKVSISKQLLRFPWEKWFYVRF